MKNFVKKRNIFKHRRQHQKIINKIRQNQQKTDFIYHYEDEILLLEKEKINVDIKDDFIQIMKKAYVFCE